MPTFRPVPLRSDNPCPAYSIEHDADDGCNSKAGHVDGDAADDRIGIAPASEKLIPTARPRISAATITFLDSWKLVLFSTTFLTPIAEIIPYRIRDTPPMVAVGMTSMIAANFGEKESAIA